MFAESGNKQLVLWFSLRKLETQKAKFIREAKKLDFMAVYSFLSLGS